ncbi:MAG: hypothetical protein ACREDR_31985, partial [Blastocatellia bacterium]
MLAAILASVLMFGLPASPYIVRPGTARILSILRVDGSGDAHILPAPSIESLPSSEGLRPFLVDQIGFSEDDLNSMETGQTVVRILKAADRSEIAAFGIVRLNASKDLFLQKFRDIVNFKKSPEVVGSGKFSVPPTLRDLRGLEIDPDDIEALKNCQPGDCDVKLSAAEMSRFQKEINWTALDYKEKATALFKEIVFERLKSYISGGNSALAEYDDQKNSVKQGDELKSLLGASPYLYDFAPALLNYLRDYPKAPATGIESFEYWSKEKFGLKPVISITHTAIFRKTVNGQSEVLIASKQIYASHYFQASLGLTILADDLDAQGKPVTYLMYLNRSRSDALAGGFSPVRRSIVASRTRQGMEKYLKMVKSKVESAAPRSAS